MAKRKKRGANNPTQNLHSGINFTLFPEIIFSILVRLPVYDLLQVKTVCKLWFDIITSRDFTIASLQYWKSRPQIIVLQKNHLGYHSASFNFETKSKHRLHLAGYEYETVKIMSALDGLLLFLVKGASRKIFICNPITKKFKLLFYIPSWDKYEVHCTLVFDSVHQNYKVIGFRYQDPHKIDDKYFVLILNGDEGRRRTRGDLRFPVWRNVENQFQHSIRSDFSPIVIGRILYWVACTFTDRVAYLQTMDIVEEVFSAKIPLPCQPTHWCWGTCRVLEMDSRGSVYVVISCSKFKLGIWVLKHGEDHEWIKQHSIILDSILGRATNLNGFNDYMVKVLVALDANDSSLMKLVIQFRKDIYAYDFKKHLITDMAIRNYTFCSYVFVPSLISWE